MLALFVLGCSKRDEPQPEPDPGLEEVPYEPPTAAMTRLTQTQYARVVHDVFGSDIAVPARLEPDLRDGGLVAIGASKATISPRGAELYEAAAISVAAQALAEERRDDIVPCMPAAVRDEACAEQFVVETGRRLWRRPLTDDEVAKLTQLAVRAAETLGDFHVGLEHALSAMLQSPKFLFRTEIGSETSEGRVVTPYELATRLSFFLWNTAPDDALLDAAETGRLATPEGVEAEVDRMLEDERARDGVRQIFTDLFELDRLDELVKAPQVFEHASEDVGPSAREETLRTIEWLAFEQNADFRDLLTTRTTFLNRKLASIYSVPAPARDGFAMFEFPEDHPRAGTGFLGHASFLSLAAHPVSTSPTLRGKFIRQKLLCHLIPSPPAGVDTSIPEPSGEAPTLRARIQEHLSNPACSSCHLITDPMGLGLENFDGIGVYRTHDNGVLIEPAGTLDEIEFADARELASVLRGHQDFAPCLTKKVYSYALGHEPELDELELVDALAARWAADEHRLLTLLREVALSPAFRRLGGHE